MTEPETPDPGHVSDIDLAVVGASAGGVGDHAVHIARRIARLAPAYAA